MQHKLLGGKRGRRQVVGPRRPELAAAVRPPSVVVGLVLGQDRTQMPLAEDQYPVSDLRPRGEHEPWRIQAGLAGGMLALR